MAAVFPAQVSSLQVGSYFVGQYYMLLQQDPSLVHKFYNDVSTMNRFDGTRADSATGMMAQSSPPNHRQLCLMESSEVGSLALRASQGSTNNTSFDRQDIEAFISHLQFHAMQQNWMLLQVGRGLVSNSERYLHVLGGCRVPVLVLVVVHSFRQEVRQE